jgi:hypothetical protein
VNFADFVVADNFARSIATRTQRDFDANRDVDFGDFTILAANFGNRRGQALRANSLAPSIRARAATLEALQLDQAVVDLADAKEAVDDPWGDASAGRGPRKGGRYG